MPQASVAERTVYRALSAELAQAGRDVFVEYTVNVSRKPLRYRQVDLRTVLASGIEMWVEIDGPNHKGKDNKARDVELARLASEHGAVLLHWPLWRVMHSGLSPLLEAVLRGDQHRGHAEPNLDTPYRVWDSRYSR